MRAGHRPWTEQEEIALESLSNQGLPLREIGRRLGRSYHSVSNKARELGQRSPSKMLRWVDVVCLPLSRAELARRMGVGIEAVHAAKNKLRKLGFPVARLNTHGVPQ